jgi:hypothetical protein
MPFFSKIAKECEVLFSIRIHIHIDITKKSANEESDEPSSAEFVVEPIGNSRSLTFNCRSSANTITTADFSNQPPPYDPLYCRAPENMSNIPPLTHAQLHIVQDLMRHHRTSSEILAHLKARHDASGSSDRHQWASTSPGPFMATTNSIHRDLYQHMDELRKCRNEQEVMAQCHNGECIYAYRALTYHGH